MGLNTSLNYIADACQMPLEYLNGAVTGEVKGTYSPLPGLTLPLDMKARKFFYHTQAGLILHVTGHLFLMVAHYEKTNTVSAFLIDGSAVELDGVMAPPELVVTSKMTLREVVDSLRSGIVKSFVWSKQKWSPMTLA